VNLAKNGPGMLLSGEVRYNQRTLNDRSRRRLKTNMLRKGIICMKTLKTDILSILSYGILEFDNAGIDKIWEFWDAKRDWDEGSSLRGIINIPTPQ
jgi:hypothetical protein